MDALLITVIVFLILLFWVLGSSRESLFHESLFRESSSRESIVTGPVGNVNYLRLYEDFPGNELLFDFSNPEPSDKDGLKYMRYVLRGNVKSMDINLVGGAKTAHVRVWNIRDGRNNASLVSDFYENTVYTSPEARMWANENLDLLVDVSPGQRKKLDMTGPTNKILMEAYL